MFLSTVLVRLNFRPFQCIDIKGSSDRRFSINKAVLKNSQYSQEKTYVRVFFNKVTGLQACNFIKKRLQHRCFPVILQNF